MLFPLSTEKVRALSLENHLTLAVVRSGNEDCDQVVCLLRVVYLAFSSATRTLVSGSPRYGRSIFKTSGSSMHHCSARLQL